MPVVQDSAMLHLNDPDFYNVWKGQLYIHKLLVCDLELKSSNTCSVPTLLPSKLEIEKAIKLSELRKLLPKNVFEQADFTGQEVHFESVYYSLFPVEASNVQGSELDKLINWLRVEDLALIKILQDQGFFILVTPPALQLGKDRNPKESFRLNALFLFPHTKLVERREREDCTSLNQDLSLKVTSFLPSLQYAILEAQQIRKAKDIKLNSVVEQNVKQYVRLQRKNVGEIKARDTSDLSPGQKERASGKCDPLALSCLQRYLSIPVSFSLPLVKMAALLKEDIPKSNDAELYSKDVIVKDSVALDALLSVSTNKSGSSSGKSVLHENQKLPSKKKKSPKRGSRKQSKRKPTHHTSSEEREIADSSKKLKLQNEEPQKDVSPSRLTVKLASAPYSHGRKRGAEVLTAEFVNADKISLTEAVTDKRDKPQSPTITDKVLTRKSEKSPVKELFLRPERPPKRKASEPGNRNKSPETKLISEVIKRPVTRRQDETGKQKEQAERQLSKTLEALASFESSSTFRRPSPDLKLSISQSPPPAPNPNPENNIMEKRINMYESHALNLLADLALNSFGTNIPYITGESVAPKSEPLVKEKVHEDDRANSVEYPQNDCNLPVQSSTASQDPGQASNGKTAPVNVVKGSNPLHTMPQQPIEIIDKQTSYKVLIAAAKARARSNTTSKISLEHSYSQLPKDDIPDTLKKEESEATSPSSVPEATVTSPAAVATTEQSQDLPSSEEVLVEPCDDADPEISKEPRAVSKLQDKILIRFNWDAKYDFDLDSKFTNDPLEKTVNRALHGPWNPHLKEKVEDVKIILHMWLALFYSKPSQPVPSSSRKVVEHSNPAKYVSINTVLDPCFEIAESDEPQLNVPQTEKPHLINAAHQEVDKSNNNLPIDLSLSSSKPKKDYNIKLSSEIFQMYNSSSLSALYSDSLQTTMMCKMIPTSKISTPPPTNNMTTGSVPTVRSKQVNSQLTTKTDKGVDIGGSSSGKVGFRESEHKYSKGFSDVETTQRPRGTEKSLHVSCGDAVSAQYGNKDNSFTSRKGSTQIVTSSLHDVNKDNRATAESESASSQKPVLFSNTDVNVSPSDSSGPVNLLHQKYKLPRVLSTSKENAPKSDLASWMQQKNVHASSERDETIIQTAKTRIVLKPKIQKKNIDAAAAAAAASRQDTVDQNPKERETSNFQLVLTDGNRSELLISERSSPFSNDLKSSGLGESQAKSLRSENLSQLADEKAPETAGGLREVSSGQEISKDHTIPEEMKSCKGIEVNSIKDTNVLNYSPLKLMTDAKGSFKHKDILGKWSEEPLEELDSHEEKGNSMMGKTETVASESMSKLELSPSSDESSDVDDMETDCSSSYSQPVQKVQEGKSGTGLLENIDQKEATDDGTVPQESSGINNGLLPITMQVSEMNRVKENDKDLPCGSSDVADDAADDLSGLSTDPQLQVTETMNNQLMHSASAVETHTFEEVSPCENKLVVVNQESRQLLSAEKAEHVEMGLGDRPSLNSSSPKFSNVAETSLFERLNSETMKNNCTGQSSSPAQQPGSQSPVNSKVTLPSVKEDASLAKRSIGPADLTGSPVRDSLNDNIQCVTVSKTLTVSESLNVKDVTPENRLLDGVLESRKPSEIISPVDAININPSSNLSEKSTKDRAHRIQNTSRKEFFFKLKRICSGAGQLTNSNSEDDCISHEEPGKGISAEPKKTDKFKTLSKSELNIESISTAEEEKNNQVIHLEDNMVHGIPVFAVSLTDVEPETLLELDQMTSQSEYLSPANPDLTDGLSQGQVQEKCLFQPDSDLIQSMDQDPVHNNFLSAPISVGKCPSPKLNDHVEQCPSVEKSLAPPNVDFADHMAQSPVGAVNLVQPNVNLIEGIDQDAVDNGLTCNNGFSDPIAHSPGGDTGLLQNTGTVPPRFGLVASQNQDPLQDVNQSSPTNECNDVLEQNQAFTNVEVDRDQNKCSSSLHEDSEMQGQSSMQNECINTSSNTGIENLEMATAQGHPPLHDDMEQTPAQDTCIPPCNVGLDEQNHLHNKCPSPADNELKDGLEQSQVLDKLQSPSHDEFTDSMEQEEPSEMCCIVTTGSISREQYERWSETSDEDIEVIQAYKETLSEKASSHYRLLSTPKSSRPSKKKRHSDASFYDRDDDDYLGYLRDHPGPYVSKNAGRTLYRADMQYMDTLITHQRMFPHDLTQNTVETEQLRFMCKLKDILRKSSTDVSEPPFQTMFESKRIPSSSGSRRKCKSPLRITVRCPSHKRDWRGHESWHPSSSYEHPYIDEPRDRLAYYSRTSQKWRTHRQSSPYHFNRLRFENTQEKTSSDIAGILNECVQSNNLKLQHISLGKTGVERTSTGLEPEENRRQTRQTGEPQTSKSQTVGNLISDFCTSLHSKLHSVAKKTEKPNLYFYLCKPEDVEDEDDFFSSTKALLIKGGYVPIEPRNFLDGEQAEFNKLVVAIKNEHVSSYIHKIPCLLQLKLHPDVTFAGVESPEDITESMHHELFQAGGFVVSSKSLLENIMIGKLKEVLMALERMNRTSVWKWFIHYGENRKLKEDKSAVSASQSKMALLKSYQHSNMIEILPYHQCDSKSKEPSSDLKCLLGLQTQHVCSRLAVYLAAMPCPEAEDFEQNGILVYDVDTFIRRIQKVDAQLQSSWS